MSLLYALTGSWDAPGGNVRPHAAGRQRPGAALAAARGPAREGAGPRRAAARARRAWAGRPASTSTAPSCTARRTRCAGWWASAPTCCCRSPTPTSRAPRSSRLDFLVYADLFLTPTAALADVVLPVSTAWEREGLRVGFGPTHAGERHMPAAPRGGARRGARRARTSGSPASWPAPRARRSLLRRRRGRGPRFMLAPTGVTLTALRERPAGVSRAGRAPLPALRGAPRATASRASRRRAGAWRSTPARSSSIGQAPLPEYVEPAVSPVSRPDLAARYPLVLTTAKVVQFCHSQHRSLPRLRRHSPDPHVELHPAAARRAGDRGGRLGDDRDAAGDDARARAA